MGCRQHNWISSTKASNEMFPLLIRLCDDKWGSFGCVFRAAGNVTPSSARYFTATLVEFARNVGLSIAKDGYSRFSASHPDDSGMRVKVSRFVETRHGLGPGDVVIMYLPRIAFGVRHIGSGFRDLLSSDFLKIPRMISVKHQSFLEQSTPHILFKRFSVDPFDSQWILFDFSSVNFFRFEILFHYSKWRNPCGSSIIQISKAFAFRSCKGLLRSP